LKRTEKHLNSLGLGGLQDIGAKKLAVSSVEAARIMSSLIHLKQSPSTNSLAMVV
jgi:hypothetical protein